MLIAAGLLPGLGSVPPDFGSGGLFVCGFWDNLDPEGAVIVRGNNSDTGTGSISVISFKISTEWIFSDTGNPNKNFSCIRDSL